MHIPTHIYTKQGENTCAVILRTDSNNIVYILNHNDIHPLGAKQHGQTKPTILGLYDNNIVCCAQSKFPWKEQATHLSLIKLKCSQGECMTKCQSDCQCQRPIWQMFSVWHPQGRR